MYIAAILAIIAAAVSIYATLEAGKQAERASKAQQKIFQQQAQQSKDAAALQERNQRKRDQFILAEQRARAGASGVDIQSGSPLSVFADSTREAEISALSHRFAGESQARGLLAQGDLVRFEGKVKRQQSYISAIAQGFSLASSVAGGMSGGGATASAGIGGGGSPSTQSSNPYAYQAYRAGERASYSSAYGRN